MVFVLKRTPAFQLFGPFQDRSQALDWIKQHANQRRYACCILEPLEPPDAGQGQNCLGCRLRQYEPGRPSAILSAAFSISVAFQAMADTTITRRAGFTHADFPRIMNAPFVRLRRRRLAMAPA